MTQKKKIAPSILSSDFAHLADEIAATPNDLPGALQRYEAVRLPATASEARLPCTVSVKGSTRRSPPP